MELPQPSTFTCFPRLPTELRLKIWRHAQPVRFLEISLHEVARFSTRFAPPTILSINRESREEALKSYQIFELDLFWGFDPKATRTITYKFIFNRDRDTIYLSTRSCGHVLHEDVNRVFDRIRGLSLRSLAVEDSIAYDVDKFGWKLLKLETVEELVVVAPYGDRPGHTELLEPDVEDDEGAETRASKTNFQKELLSFVRKRKEAYPEERLPAVRVVQFLSYPPQRDPLCYSAGLIRSKFSETHGSSREENGVERASYPVLTHQQEYSERRPFRTPDRGLSRIKGWVVGMFSPLFIRKVRS
jgi:hypothetical protein